MSNTRTKRKSITEKKENDSTTEQKEINQTTDNQPAAATNTTSNFPTYKEKEAGEFFTARDYEFLSENENYRYLPNSTTVGHAVIMKNDQGEKVALQYAIPQEDGNAPKV